MTPIMADAPYTISGSGLSYGEPEARAPRDVALTAARDKPNEMALPFQGGTLVIHVAPRAPLWLGPTVAVLKELLLLEHNWDSYGALPVDVLQVLAALEWLDGIMQDDMPTPQLVPTNRGGIQIEWHHSGIDIEIETLVRKRFLVSYEDRNRSEEDEWEQDLGSDWTRLSAVLARLS